MPFRRCSSLSPFYSTSGCSTGRSSRGYALALESRYITYNLLIFVAVYMTAVERWDTLAAVLRAVFTPVTVGLVTILIGVSVTTAVTRGETYAARLRQSQSVLVNYPTATDRLIKENPDHRPSL